jgi:hypothetical protein
VLSLAPTSADQRRLFSPPFSFLDADAKQGGSSPGAAALNPAPSPDALRLDLRDGSNGSRRRSRLDRDRRGKGCGAETDAV